MEDRIGRIQSKFEQRSRGWMRRIDEVFELFRAFDMCIVSSLHDGMNLVAKEFVAARGDEHGVVAALGLLAGAALGMRVLGLLLLIYSGFAIALCMPRPWLGPNRAGWRFGAESLLRLLPALLLTYVTMAFAWPWATLAPLNPIRGLFAFSEFHYPIRTILDGTVYEMAHVPRLYVPIYILIRLPLLTLFGAALGMIFACCRGWPQVQNKCGERTSPWSH